jgi:hypothetical protein
MQDQQATELPFEHVTPHRGKESQACSVLAGRQAGQNLEHFAQLGMCMNLLQKPLKEPSLSVDD